MCTLLIPCYCVISQESPRQLLATNTQDAGEEWAQASRLLQSCSRALCDTSVTNAARKGKVETLEKSAALLFPSTCVTMRDLRDTARCFTSILPQGQSLCCFIAERFKMRNLRSSCWQRINVCSLLY